MNKPQRLLVIEIKTMVNPGLDYSQLSTITAFDDSTRLYLGCNLESISSAILDGIVHLGSNYRHPLLFEVQVLPGDEMDAYLASVKVSQTGLKRRRKRAKG